MTVPSHDRVWTRSSDIAPRLPWFKQLVGWDQMPELARARYRKLYFRLARYGLATMSMFPLPLDLLARISRTDKLGSEYTPIYHRLLAPYKWKSINLLEIGVGGYDDPEDGGRSLLMWQAFFPRGRIYAIDVYDKTALSRGRVKVFKGSQDDQRFLASVVEEAGGFDIVIDDGSHINQHQIVSFQHLFPHLNNGGLYIIEDVGSSYWPAYGGGLRGTSGYQESCMAFMKELVDGLNHADFLDREKPRTAFDTAITSVQFWRSLIVIMKGDNGAGSNLDLDANRVALMETRTIDGKHFVDGRT